MSDKDGPVVGDGPARVVRDFPHVAIRVGEGSGHAAPLGTCRRPHDLPASLLGLGKYYRDLFGDSNILREFDTGCAVPPARGPEPQDHATSLEEADLLVRLLCAVPAHRLIKGSGPGQIGDAKGYQTDALLHLASIAVDHELCCHLYAASARRLPYTDRLPRRVPAEPVSHLEADEQANSGDPQGTRKPSSDARGEAQWAVVAYVPYDTSFEAPD